MLTAKPLRRNMKANIDKRNESRHRLHKSYNSAQRMGGCMVSRPANDTDAKRVAYSAVSEAPSLSLVRPNVIGDPVAHPQSLHGISLLPIAHRCL